MRKTFLKVSLFSFLALGMSTAFVGCKDYDDDIDQLRTEIAANKTAIEAINQKISQGAILNSVVPTEDGKGIVISVTKDGNTQTYTIKNGENGQDGTTAQVWDIREVDGKAYWFKNGENTNIPAQGKDGVGTTGETGAPGNYWAPNEEGTKLEEYAWNADAKKYEKTGKSVDIAITVEGDKTPGITAVADANYVYLTGVQTGTDEAGKPVFGTVAISRNGLLRGLVFIPDLYEAGVEASRYVYAPVMYKEAQAAGKTIAADANNEELKVENTLPKDWKYSVPAAAKETYIYPIQHVNYELNPANANIEKLAYNIIVDDKEFLQGSRAADEPTMVFEVVNNDLVKPVSKNGNLNVPYKATKGAELVKYLEAGKDGELTVMALEATVKEDDKVTSNYSAIVPAVRKLQAISFTAASTYTTKETHNLELYSDGEKAVSNVASIMWKYNGGDLDLASKLQVCYTQADFKEPAANAEHKFMTLAELADYGLTVKYSLLAYKVGNSETVESQYATINENGVLTPMHIGDNGTPVANGMGDNAAGISSVNRRPVVVVTIVNAEGKVVLAGYAKIQYTNTVDPVVKGFVLNPGAAALPYLCSTEVESTWEQWSGKLLEAMDIKLDHSNFSENYTWAEDGKTYVAVTADGKTTYKDVSTITPAVSYGTIVFDDDEFAASANGVLTWTATAAQQKAVFDANAEHKITLYTKFNSVKGTGDLYVGLEMTVLPAPTATYGVKYTNQWYADSKGVAESRINVNVPYPSTSATNVLSYKKELNEYFLENTVKVTPAGTGYDWATALKDLPLAYSYKLSAVQPKIVKGDKEYQLVADGNNLKVGTVTIATLTAAGQLVYAPGATAAANNNTLAKEILNLFGHNEAYPNWTYANVEITSTYGDCKLPFNGVLSFESRFLRPIDVNNGQGVEFEDAVADGDAEPLAKFFTLSDWRDRALFTVNAAGVATAATENGVNLYDYYEIATVAFEKNKVQVQDGSTWYTMDKLPGLDLKLVGKDGATVTTTAGVSTASIATVAALNKLELVWYNNSGTTKEFNIKVPVTITYSWGTITAEVTGKVKKTINN